MSCCTNCFERDHSARACKTAKRCGRCKGTDHVLRACPSATTDCFFCLAKGHDAFRCPKIRGKVRSSKSAAAPAQRQQPPPDRRDPNAFPPVAVRAPPAGWAGVVAADQKQNAADDRLDRLEHLLHTMLASFAQMHSSIALLGSVLARLAPQVLNLDPEQKAGLEHLCRSHEASSASAASLPARHEFQDTPSKPSASKRHHASMSGQSADGHAFGSSLPDASVLQQPAGKLVPLQTMQQDMQHERKSAPKLQQQPSAKKSLIPVLQQTSGQPAASTAPSTTVGRGPRVDANRAARVPALTRSAAATTAAGAAAAAESRIGARPAAMDDSDNENALPAVPAPASAAAAAAAAPPPSK